MERTHLDKEGLNYTLQKINQKYETEILKRLKQYTVLPTASEGYAGQIVQYIGESTEDYEKSHCYECKIDEETGEYIWASFSVTGKLVTAVLSKEVMPEPSSDYDTNLIIYTGATDENYTRGHMYYCEMVSDAYAFTDLTPETSIPDNETIIKDPQTGVISISPKYKIAFIGEQDDWDALTSEQKDIFDGSIVIITDDYIEDESDYTAIDDIVPNSNNLVKSKALAEAIEWSQEVLAVWNKPQTQGDPYHYSRAAFSRTIKPHSTNIYKIIAPRSNGKLVRAFLNLYNSVTGNIRTGDFKSIVPQSQNDRQHSIFLIVTNDTDNEYTVALTYMGNASGYAVNDLFCYVSYNNLDESSKQSLAESLISDSFCMSFTIE